ncbi:hypothetical protein D3C87_1636190 [compost metagenome]
MPARNFGTGYRRAEEYAAVTIRLLPEFEGQVEVLVKLVGSEVAVFLVGAAFADELAAIDVPFLGTVDGPAFEVFPVE